MAVVESCCGTVPDWTGLLCNNGYSARVKSIALVSKCFQNEGTPPYNQAFWGSNAIWESLTEGLIAPFTQVYAVIADRFNGSVASEAIYAEGQGDQSERLTGWNFTIAGQFLFTPENQTFWESVNGSSDYWLVYNIDNLIFVTECVVSIAGAAIASNSLSDNIMWQVEIKWQRKAQSLPKSYTKPTDYFN